MTTLTREKETLEELLEKVRRDNTERVVSRERVEKTLADAASALTAVLTVCYRLFQHRFVSNFINQSKNVWGNCFYRTIVTL